MSVFATDRIAWGICDRCGFRYPHRTLRMEPNKSLVCPECWDVPFDIIGHPQNYPPPVSPDPQAIWNARPDVCLANNDDATWTVSMTTGR